MKLIQAISPMVPPAHIQAEGELQVNRERILQTLLLVVAAAALIGYVGLFVAMLPSFNFPLFALYTGITAIVCSFVAYRKMPYTMRSSIVVVIFLITSIYTLQLQGLEGDGKLYILTFNALATVLLGWKFGLIALIISQVSVGVMGGLMMAGVISLPAAAYTAGSLNSSSLIMTGIFLAILSTLITISLGMMMRGQENAYNRVEKLSEDLTLERNSLQDRVEQRTADLQNRMVQILTASDISKAIASFRDPTSALTQIVNLIRERFNLYYVGIFILDENNDAVLRAGSGQAGEKMVAARHTLPAGGASMIGWAIANRQARIALDVGSESVRFNNPFLPDTRSEMAIPIKREEICLGALSIQSEKANAFDEYDIRILQGIADTLASALENASLYQQSQESLEEVRALNRTYLQQAWSDLINEHGNFSYTYENTEVTHALNPNQVRIPLTLREQVIGQITLETERASLNKDQLAFIDAITTQTALALENARLLEETQQRALQEQTLNQLTAEYTHALNVDDILKSALRQLSRLPAVNEISVHLLPPDNPAAKPMVSKKNGSNGGNGGRES
jgi:GAF domain-containing protein